MNSAGETAAYTLEAATSRVHPLPGSGPDPDEAAAHWHVLRTRYRMESIVQANLARKRIACYLPRISEVRRWRDRTKTVVEALFSGYIFVRPPYDFGVLQYIPGSLDLLRWSGRPATISERTLAGIRAFTEFGKSLDVLPELRHGQTVMVLNGPLAGIKGEMVRYKDRDRLVINADFLGQSVSVEIDRSWVRPFDS